jgi:hypothetical protein
MRLIRILRRWWKGKPPRRVPPEIIERELDDEVIDRERRSAIPIDVTDYASLPDRYIRDIRYADTWS